MKYYIIAGEASGDLHGASLIKEIKAIDSHAQFRGWGGDNMQQEGLDMVKHYRDHAFMGFFEVISHLRAVLKNISLCKKDIIYYNPDAVILIDYPGFNLEIAKFSKKNKLKVFYYISPKVWAWKSSRVKTIRQNVHKLFVILPFETSFYEQYQYPVEYVGNPVVDKIEAEKNKGVERELFINNNNIPDKPIIAILPGSRIHEVQKCLPHMMEACKDFNEYQLVIAGVSTINTSYYQNYVHLPNVSLVVDQTYQLLQLAESAIVTSGTAALETALFNVPQVVCYKISLPTFMIGRLLVKIKFFTLVNLIMEKEVIKELLQFNLTNEIKSEMQKILNNAEYVKTMQNNYGRLKEKLGEKGAAQRVAKKIVYDMLNSRMD